MFNSNQDICYYYQDHLNSETVQALMLQMCDDYFELKNEFKNIQKQMTNELDEILSENSMMKNDNNVSDENTYISDDENVDVIDEMIDDEMMIDEV